MSSAETVRTEEITLSVRDGRRVTTLVNATPIRSADGAVESMVYVKPEGNRSWIQRLVVRGRRRELGLGAVALVSLAEAREVALANRKLARSGGDPLAEKRRVQGVPTFAEAARRVVDGKRGGWRGKHHAHNWLRSLERYAFPRIGPRPVSEVSSADVLEILTPIWHEKPETARAVRQRVRTALDWAVAMEMRLDNPCDRVLPVLGPQNDIVQHHLALPHRDVVAAVATVRASDSATPAVKLAFELLVLTAGRSAEVRLATWGEMDMTGRVWTISAERMKAKREHRVPLCDRALEVLAAAPSLGDGDLVFPMRSGRPIAPSTLVQMLKHRHPCRCARLPLVVPGLGGGEDGPPAGGHRGGAGARGAEQGRGGVREVGPVRAAAAADGRLGGLCRRRVCTAPVTDNRAGPRGTRPSPTT